MGATGDDFDMFDDDALPPPTSAKGGKMAPQLRRAEFAEGDDDDDGGDDAMRLYDELKNKQSQAKSDKKSAKMYACIVCLELTILFSRQPVYTCSVLFFFTVFVLLIS